MTIYRGPWKRAEAAQREILWGDDPKLSVRRLTSDGSHGFTVIVEKLPHSATVYAVTVHVAGESVHLETDALEIAAILDELSIQL